MSTAPNSSHVLTHCSDNVGEIVLNRSEKINALTHDMVSSIKAHLLAWRSDNSVRAVVIRGNGSRGFCSGGDLQPSQGNSDTFLRNEYALNALIAEYPKPIVTLLHGIAYGGGVGLGCHARIRVVTDSTKIAMPETRIGICPDVGGTLLLARAPQGIGEYHALTSLPMTAAEAVSYGFADLYLPAEVMAGVPGILRETRGENCEAHLFGLAAPYRFTPAPAPEWIVDGFSGATVPDILRRLRALAPPAAAAAVERILMMSPTALVVTLHAVRRAREHGNLRKALQTELEILTALAARDDLSEGIAARLVERRKPQWRPARLEDVDPLEISAIVSHKLDPLEFV